MMEPHRIKNFWKKVQKTETCWNWTGAKTSDGYGVFNGGTLGKSCTASRISWMLVHGLIPSTVCVCHKCDNRACVNPEHLFTGTNQENMDDMKSKGRAARGQKNYNAKLTEEKAFEVKTLLSLGESCRDIAEKFGVYHSTIRKIRNGHTWAHINPQSNVCSNPASRVEIQ